MTVHVAFDCGACVEYLPGQTVQEVSDDHYATCRLCPDERTPHEKQLDELHQKNWEARVDAALNDARRTA